MTLVGVVAGGMLGALARYLLDRSARARWPEGVQWGIVACNLGGAFLLGVFAGAAVSQEISAAGGAGFCGALTTYSTLSYDTVRLWERGKRREAFGNLAWNVGCGLPLALCGIAVGSLLR